MLGAYQHKPTKDRKETEQKLTSAAQQVNEQLNGAIHKHLLLLVFLKILNHFI